MTKNRGRIPEKPREPSATDVLYEKTRDEWRGKSLDELTAAFNALEVVAAELRARAAEISTKQDAIEVLIREKIEATGADNLSVNGYTWTPKADAYASATDPQALVQYFIDNKMTHMLSVHPSRLTATVREEIEANTIEIGTKEIPNPNVPGETIEVPEVRSSLPGVTVFLKSSLGRTLSSRSPKKEKHAEEE